MYDNLVTLSAAPEVQAVVRAAFPSYRKRKAYLEPWHGSHNVNSYWSGGSKAEYAIVHLATLQRRPLPTMTCPSYEVADRGTRNVTNGVVSVDHVGNITLNVLPDGYALVQAGTGCDGKPATAFVYVNAANLTKLLGGQVNPNTIGGEF
jgi:hypothetical protein